MTRYTLVPGACHGGWWYQPVVDALRAAGHEADPITLSGLEPDGPSTAVPGPIRSAPSCSGRS